MDIVTIGIIVLIIIGALTVLFKKGKTPNNAGSSDTEPGNGDLGGGLGKNK